tara:strand:+ start:397 stop:1116 length:720 start_codon:yes stop_codon:yes gene_type:complete
MTIELLDKTSGCFHDISLSYGLYGSLFIAGIVGGFTHCMAMCGPFVLSQAGQFSRLKDSALIPYHMGRVTTYITLAILLSSLVNIAFLFLPIRSFIVAPILMLSGILFFMTAFPTLGQFFPWLVRIKIALPYKWLMRGFDILGKKQTLLSQYFTGTLLGLMPCGLIVSALMAATMAPSAAQAGLAMASFGLGTMPALITLAFSGQFLQQKYPRAMQRITQIMMVWSGVWLFTIAGMMLT